MRINRKTWALISLIAISICSFILWRIELFNHGWDGLTWIGYFHYAVIYGFLLFMIWANFIIYPALNIPKLILLNIIFPIICASYYYLLVSIYLAQHITGPGALLYKVPGWIFYLGPFPDQALMILFILLTVTILTLFRVRLNKIFIGISIVISLLSFPLSMYFMGFMNFIGSPDHIHMIKTGIIIPFLIIPIGLVIAGVKIPTTSTKLRKISK